MGIKNRLFVFHGPNRFQICRATQILRSNFFLLLTIFNFFISTCKTDLIGKSSCKKRFDFSRSIEHTNLAEPSTRLEGLRGGEKITEK